MNELIGRHLVEDKEEENLDGEQHPGVVREGEARERDLGGFFDA
jgi:hypothetical protein